MCVKTVKYGHLVWVVGKQDNVFPGEELEALEDAYRAMSKLTAEYLMVEKAAAKVGHSKL